MRISDWSSDVCSSDLKTRENADANGGKQRPATLWRGAVKGKERPLSDQQRPPCERYQHANHDGHEAARFPFEQQYLNSEQNGRQRCTENGGHASRGARDEQRLALCRTPAETLGEQRPDGSRSEERRVGQECVSTCRSMWPPYPHTKQITASTPPQQQPPKHQ